MNNVALDFNYLLLENYKKLNLSENDVATLLMIDHLISDGNLFITADLLSLKMALPIEEIDKIFADLLTRGFIEYAVSNNSTITTLKPLQDKLLKEFQLRLSAEQSESTYDFNPLFTAFEKTFGRPLSQVEISKIKEWVFLGYSEEKIKNALKEAITKEGKTLREVEKVLLQWTARDDIEKDGSSPITDNWQKNLEETIRIAKTPWLDVDEKNK